MQSGRDLRFFRSKRLEILHIFALFSVTVAYPLMSFLLQNLTYLVANNVSTTMIYGLCAVIYFLIPGLLAGMLYIAHSFGERFQGVVHHGIVYAFLTLYFLPLLSGMKINQDEYIPGWPTILVAMLLGAILLSFYRHNKYVYAAFTLVSPVTVVFAAYFLSNPGIQKILNQHEYDQNFYGSVDFDQAPSIVIVVFDELPLAALLDTDGEIDVNRFPNFHDLAQRSTWYRNATTVHNHTLRSIPSILTGEYPLPGNILPLNQNFPNSIFNVLYEHYTLDTFEQATSLAPPRGGLSASRRPKANVSVFAGDLFALYLHSILPGVITRRWVPLEEGVWSGFFPRFNLHPHSTEGQVVSWMKENLNKNPTNVIDAFESYIDEMNSFPRTTLHYMHTLFPHRPYKFLPSGKRYNFTEWPNFRMRVDSSVMDSVRYSEQRMQAHVLQLAYADVMLGKFMAKLRDNPVYDESIIVIVADHGIVFSPDTYFRKVSKETMGAIGFVPLFIKYPGQTEGMTDRTNVQTIDIVPTILDVLGADPAPQVDGRSLIDRQAIIPKTKRIMNEDGGVLEMSLGDSVASLRREIELYVKVLAIDNTKSTLFQLGPGLEYLGETLDVVKSISVPAEIECPGIDRLVSVNKEDTLLPIIVKGRLTCSEDYQTTNLILAISINDTIRATCSLVGKDGAYTFHSALPETAFNPGENTFAFALLHTE